MLKQKLEKSEKSRNELRQNSDLLESKVPHPTYVGPVRGEVCCGGSWGPSTAWHCSGCSRSPSKEVTRCLLPLSPIYRGGDWGAGIGSVS